EIARAVTDSMPSSIKGSKRHYENVRRHLRRPRHRLTYSPQAGRQCVAEIPGTHGQWFAASGDGWQRQLRAGIGKLAHQGHRVDFAFHRRKAGNNSAMFDL